MPVPYMLRPGLEVNEVLKSVIARSISRVRVHYLSDFDNSLLGKKTEDSS